MPDWFDVDVEQDGRLALTGPAIGCAPRDLGDVEINSAELTARNVGRIAACRQKPVNVSGHRTSKDVKLLVLRREVAVLRRANPRLRLEWADRAF